VGDRLRLTRSLSRRPAGLKRAAACPRVIRDLAVRLAGGGECVSDLGAVRDQRALFGTVADRVPGDRPDGAKAGLCSDALRAAHARARRATPRAGSLPRIRREVNAVRLRAAIGYAAPDDERRDRGPQIRRARPAGLRGARAEPIKHNRKGQAMTIPTSVGRALPPVLQRDGARVREAVARRHARRRSRH
jgi:hypothetical protein